jgi:hypothetical protein
MRSRDALVLGLAFSELIGIEAEKIDHRKR